MTKNQQLILNNCDEFEPLDNASGGLCLDGTHAGKTISYGTCKTCLTKQGIDIKISNEIRQSQPCKTCRGL